MKKPGTLMTKRSASPAFSRSGACDCLPGATLWTVLAGALAAAAVTSVLAGCESKTQAPLGADKRGGGTNGGGSGEEQTFADHWTQAIPTQEGTGTLDPNNLAEGKHARRVSVDQLRNSIPALFGGLTWTIPVGRNQVNGFDALSRTLGEADYIQATASNLDASPLFAKFMDDMAGDVCTKAIARDRTTPNASDRLVIRDRADVDGTLRFLRLKLHQIPVPDGSTEGLEELRQLYDDILRDTNDADTAWTGVCVAMITAPEFMAY